MFEEIITAFPEEEEEEVAADISKYDLLAMPVVDESGRMLGIVTVDDAMEVIEDDAEEGKTRWAWTQLIAVIVIFIIFLVPYTFVILQIAGGLN